MSCVLRVTSDDPNLALSPLSLQPYRNDRGTTHFLVSECDLDNLQGQVQDATDFLVANEAALAVILGAPGTTAALDFATEVSASTFCYAKLTPELVRRAGSLGLALEVSIYPGALSK